MINNLLLQSVTFLPAVYIYIVKEIKKQCDYEVANWYSSSMLQVFGNQHKLPQNSISISKCREQQESNHKIQHFKTNFRKFAIKMEAYVHTTMIVSQRVRQVVHLSSQQVHFLVIFCQKKTFKMTKNQWNMLILDAFIGRW